MSLKVIGKNILHHDIILKKGDISGSLSSTGSFGHLNVQGNITASGTVRADAFESVTGGNAIDFKDSIDVTGGITAQTFSGIFNGALSSSAQIASNISGSFTADSSSIASRLSTEEANVNALQTDSGSFSTRTTTLETTMVSEQSNIDTLQSTLASEQTNIDNLQTDSGSFSTRLTTAESELGNTLISSSFQISGNISGSFTDVSASLASRIGTSAEASFNGNRRVLNTGFPNLFSSSYNAGTTGSLSQFIEKVFFDNAPPVISNTSHTVNEFVASGTTIGTVSASDTEAEPGELSFAKQDSYTDNFFTIHSGSGVVTSVVATTASMNTQNRGDGELAHPFPIKVSDTITETTATVFIRVTPNTAPKFRTTSVAGSIIANNTGSVNENTTNNTTILTMFITDDESDTLTISPLSQSVANRFAMNTSNVSGGKRIIITTNTASFDYESITSHQLFVSASDEHYGNTPSSSGYITTLPILINVTDNLAPTMGSQAFSLNESIGSHTNHGLGTSTNNVQTIGTLSTNDNEGDTVTFTGLALTSGSGGSNASQTDISNDPFQVTSAGVIQLKAGQYLNSDIFNQYKYNATYKDNFNNASSSGVVTLNIQDDAIPTLTNNGPFYIIESATDGDNIRINSNGRTGTRADFNSNETVTFNVNPSNKFSVDSNGRVDVNFDVSSSAFTFDAGNPIIGSMTASNAFGTFTQSAFSVNVAKNNSPSIAYSDTSGNQNSNLARPSATLSTISFSDTEGDSINAGALVFTDPSGQLEAVQSGGNYLIRPITNLSGSTLYRFTSSIQDEHGFRSTTESDSFTVAAADTGTLGGNTTSFIIESATNGSNLKTNSNGRSGGNATLSVSYSPNYGSAAVASYTSSNAQIAVNNSGVLSLGFQLSGSSVTSSDSITSTITYRDQYDNIGTGNITVNVAQNFSPTTTFTNTSGNLNSNLARPSNVITTISFSDDEGDALRHSSFVFTDPSGDLQANKVGDTYQIVPTSNLNGSTNYRMTSSIKDVQGFSTSVKNHILSIAQAPIGTMSTNGTFYIIESATTNDLIRTNSNGRTGTQGDLNVTYSPNYGSAAVTQFTSSNAMLAISNAGAISLAQNVSGSAFTFNAGNPITSNITYRDQYNNIGSGSISINVAKNNPPVITLNPTSPTVTSENAVSGSFIASASFSDTEGDTVNYDTFAFGGTNGNLFSASLSGTSMIITANQDISGSSTAYSYNVTVKDNHGFHTSNATSGNVTVKPMIYLYKQTARMGVMNAANSLGILGDSDGTDTSVNSGSLLGHFKAGNIGIGFTSSYGETATVTLMASQSSYRLDKNGSENVWRQFGNVDLSGNSNNGHSWIVVFPSSSAMNPLPLTLGNEMNSPHPAGEYVVWNDNASSDAVEGAGLHYFGTNAGVKIRGTERFGMIHGLGPNTGGSQYYHLLSSSGSAPSSEV